MNNRPCWWYAYFNQDISISFVLIKNYHGSIKCDSSYWSWEGFIYLILRVHNSHDKRFTPWPSTSKRGKVKREGHTITQIVE